MPILRCCIMIAMKKFLVDHLSISNMIGCYEEKLYSSAIAPLTLSGVPLEFCYLYNLIHVDNNLNSNVN